MEDKKPQDIKPSESELRKEIAWRVLDFHRDKSAETKRIIQDCEALYDFISKYLK